MDRCKLMGRRDPTPPKPPSRKAQRTCGYPDHPPAPAALASEAKARVQAESTPRFSLKTAQEIERRAGDKRAHGRLPSSPADTWRGPQKAQIAVSWQYTVPDPVSVTRRSTDSVSVLQHASVLPRREQCCDGHTHETQRVFGRMRTPDSRIKCPIKSSSMRHGFFTMESQAFNSCVSVALPYLIKALSLLSAQLSADS